MRSEGARLGVWPSLVNALLGAPARGSLAARGKAADALGLTVPRSP